MRRSYQSRKMERRARKPAELLLVPMIDIFTVLVTFLLMTAVFSRTVILQLNLPAAQNGVQGAPAGAGAGGDGAQGPAGGPTATPGRWQRFPTPPRAMTTTALTEYLKRVKAKFPEKTEATILLEPDTPYDKVVQVMDHVRVFEQGEGANIVQAELFPTSPWAMRPRRMPRAHPPAHRSAGAHP